MKCIRFPLLAALTLVIFTSACRQGAEPKLPADDDAPITTDALRYTPEDLGDYLRYTLEASYTNSTDASVYLSPCGFEPPVYGLERFEDGSWQPTAGGPPCPSVGGVPDTEVAPGQSFSTTLTLYAFRLPNAYPQLGTDLAPGVHRLTFVVTSTETGDELIGEHDLLPLEGRVSNAFELRAP